MYVSYVYNSWVRTKFTCSDCGLALLPSQAGRDKSWTKEASMFYSPITLLGMLDDEMKKKKNRSQRHAILSFLEK